jgi:hypothetical protein
MHVEHEYYRCGAWTYLAALDVHRARVFGRCETSNGIAPFDRLVEQVMTRPPYDDAPRVLDCGQLLRSSRRLSGRTSPEPPSSIGPCSRPCSCQLAESGRDLFLYSPAQGPVSQRFHRARSPCRTSARFLVLQGINGPALRVEILSPRPHGSPRQAPQPTAPVTL